jgi:hypothetical protein
MSSMIEILGKMYRIFDECVNFESFLKLGVTNAASSSIAHSIFSSAFHVLIARITDLSTMKKTEFNEPILKCFIIKAQLFSQLKQLHLLQVVNSCHLDLYFM